MADHYGSPEIDLNGLCVLIVDDSFAAALGVKRLLEAWGPTSLDQPQPSPKLSIWSPSEIRTWQSWTSRSVVASNLTA